VNPSTKNPEVTHFLDGLNHPMRDVIEMLRRTLLSAVPGLQENIKWNGPNYCVHGEDRITMRIHPPKQIQLVLHRGAKKLDPPTERLINDPSGVLIWKGNDRAIATFATVDSIDVDALGEIARQWVLATLG